MYNIIRYGLHGPVEKSDSHNNVKPNLSNNCDMIILKKCRNGKCGGGGDGSTRTKSSTSIVGSKKKLRTKNMKQQYKHVI